MENFNLFVQVYDFLLEMEGNTIIPWLGVDWKGKDKQETILRLFANLGLIEKLNEYNICVGNYNLWEFRVVKSKREYFFENSKPKKIKDKGDASDLTGVHKENNKRILATTSKNYKNYTIGKLGISQIVDIFNEKKKKDKDLELSLCICVRSREDLIKKAEKANKSSRILKKYIDNAIIIDWSDLDEAYKRFKNVYQDIPFESLIKVTKNPLMLKMHQKLTVMKTIELKQQGKTNILWGHIQRSGKSYIMSGAIMFDMKGKDKCNYLIITTVPNETIEQYLNVFKCSQFDKINVVLLNGNNKKPLLKNKNVIICSKQFLEKKIKGHSVIPWLKTMNFDMRFIDESHNGGTTQLAKNTLNFYGAESFTVYITATYVKPVYYYYIPKEDCIFWDLEDIRLCQNIKNELNRKRMIEKHGKFMKGVLNEYTKETIMEEYSRYPSLQILSERLRDRESVDEVIRRINELEGEGKDYGWSVVGCQTLKQDEKKRYSAFQNRDAALRLWCRVRNLVIRDRKDICNKLNSRFLPNEAGNIPEIIMVFLPQNDIDLVSQATKTLLEEEELFSTYNIIRVTSKLNGNQSKNNIDKAYIQARNNNKDGIIVLSGKQCSMGVSFPKCDTVVLLNNNNSYDMIHQMMFRSMTEDEGKKCGFVIDLNIHRVIQSVLVESANNTNPHLPLKDGLRYIFDERLITLNANDWINEFGKNQKELERFCDYIYEIYKSRPVCVFNRFMNLIKIKLKILSSDDPEFKFLKTYFNVNKMSKRDKVTIKNFIEGKKEDLNKGIKTTKNENINEKQKEDEEKEKEKEKEEDKEDKEEDFDPVEIIVYIIPLICILTIQDKSSSFDEMVNIIKNNKGYLEIFIEQMNFIGGMNIEAEFMARILSLYVNSLQHDLEFKRYIQDLKETFSKNLTNHKDLSQLIDTYIVPEHNEKKMNAEISTPYFLRQDMLNKVPTEFWTSPKKVFEPCAGKGGFLIDIIEKFMEGLKEKYPNEKERYRVIVEECLYFSDINSMNIFIDKMLIDPYGDYNLNYYKGDTLKLDIKETWNIQFDLVVGNPPYNDASGNKGKGHTLWTRFIEVALDKWVKKNGFLLYVTPSLWRQVEHPLQKTMKTYQIHYLEIHGEKDGVKTFKCNTRYDWFLIQKKSYTKPTEIKLQTGEVVTRDLKPMPFIPNYNFNLLEKLMEGNEKVEILQSRSAYGADKKHTSKIRNETFKFPVVYSVNRKDEVTFMWSNTTGNGMFGRSKVIFGSGATGFTIDLYGEYGLTQWATGIVDSQENLPKIKDALNSSKFKEDVVLAISVSKAEINSKALKYFQKDFWKYFT